MRSGLRGVFSAPLFEFAMPVADISRCSVPGARTYGPALAGTPDLLAHVRVSFDG